MAIQFETTTTWPAPMTRVLAMITDPAYLMLRMDRMGYVGAEIVESTVDEQRSAFVLRAQAKPTVKVPAIAKKFVREDQLITLSQTEEWCKTTATGTLRLQTVSVVDVTAKMQLTEADGVTTNRIAWTVSCDLPLIGHKLAAIIAEDLQAKAALNARVSQEIMAEQFS